MSSHRDLSRHSMVDQKRRRRSSPPVVLRKEWAALTETEQTRIYANYEAIDTTKGFATAKRIVSRQYGTIEELVASDSAHGTNAIADQCTRQRGLCLE